LLVRCTGTHQSVGALVDAQVDLIHVLSFACVSSACDVTRASMSDHNYFANLIWQIADLLRGPYRPPQYERVMLP
jgi:hypothetical protein